MEIELKEGERLDELQRNGYRIIQDPGRFCFGMDAVLLSGFARVKEGERVLDLGTGTGIIPILLRGKTKGRDFTGLEIQKESADMARRSVELNDLADSISIVEGDIKEAASLFGAASFDVVTCNPPYMTDLHGLQNPELPKAIARHELLCSFEDVAREAGYYPKPANGDRWAEEHEIPAIRMGPRKRGYETDLVARAIVQSRGMWNTRRPCWGRPTRRTSSWV